MSIRFFDYDLILGSSKWTQEEFPFMEPFKYTDVMRVGNVQGGPPEPTWQDIVISGVGSLTLTKAKADGLNYLKLFGGSELLPENYIDSVTLEGKCEQTGTPTPDNPVDIVCNNGVIKYSINKANYTEENVTLGYWITNTTGAFEASPPNFCTSMMPVKPDTSYICYGRDKSTSVLSGYNRIAWYDSNGNWIRNSTYTQGTIGKGTSPSNAAYARFHCNIDGNTVTQELIDSYNWTFCEGDVEVPYTPYVEGGIYVEGTTETAADNVGNVATAEMLLSVSDYKDTQEVLSGAITRNIEVLVLDGTENWTQATTSLGVYRYRFEPTNAPKLDGGRGHCISTHFFDIGGVTTQDIGGGFASTTYLYFIPNQDVDTVEKWTAFLADQYANGTPVIVIYQLSEPTTEAVTGQFLSKEPVTVAGSLTGLVANVTSSPRTTPTPTQPLPINTNNGVLTFGAGNTYTTVDGQGTFVTPSALTTTRIYKAFGQLKAGKYYIKVTGDFEFIFQYKDTMDRVPTQYGNMGTWTTEGEYDVTDASMYYGVAIRNAGGSGNIYPSNFNNIGSIGYAYLDVVPVGTVETVQVHGINIFNKNDTENIGNWYSGSNQTITQANANETLVMRAKPNTTYYFKHCSVKGGCRAFYTEVENWTTGSACSAMSGNAGANANVVYSITTSANAKWIFFNCGRNNAEASFDDQRNDFMVSTSELTSDTPYEPYYNGGSATAEMLLKVGDYQDVQSVLDGQVTRNVGIKVFDGSENFSTSNATFTYAVSDRVTAKTPLICSHFEYSTKTSSQVEDLKIISFSSTNIGFRYDACADTTAFKASLKSQYNNGTPVIVVYPLAEPTTETVTAQPLTIQAETNVVEITQASMDNLELEVGYKQRVDN